MSFYLNWIFFENIMNWFNIIVCANVCCNVCANVCRKHYYIRDLNRLHQPNLSIVCFYAMVALESSVLGSVFCSLMALPSMSNKNSNKAWREKWECILCNSILKFFFSLNYAELCCLKSRKRNIVNYFYCNLSVKWSIKFFTIIIILEQMQVSPLRKREKYTNTESHKIK